MSYYPNVYASQTGPLLLSGLDANFNFAVDIQSQSLYAAAGGAADIITATYTPAVTSLISGLTLYLRASTANVTTTPTFSPNSLTARTIVKANNQALAVGDIAGAGHILILQYDATNTVWELANPATANTSFPGGTANGVLYLNGSKVATSGTALTFDGTNFATTGTATAAKLIPTGSSATGNGLYLPAANSVGISTNGTNAVYIDASQNVGVGVTPSAWLVSSKNLQLNNVSISSQGGNPSLAEFGVNWYYNLSATQTYISSTTASKYQQFLGAHNWFTAPSGTAGNAITFTQAMTLDSSGNLLVGVTSVATLDVNAVSISPANKQVAIFHLTGTSSGTNYLNFLLAGGSIGTITQNGTTGVLYNLTSDYRLKNNQEALTGAKDFIMALKPKKWQWWDGSGEGVGFVAHEFMEVAKHSGHGKKDAVETIEIKDEDGNVTGTEERPVYQSIQPSSSEVMANLVSLIQEQQALIETLKARLDAAGL